MDFSKILLDDLGGGNASFSFAPYENQAMKPNPQNWIAKRYGCDRKANHHARARCVLQGRLSQLKLQLERTFDPKERMRLQIRIYKWQRKLSDEIRRNRFRKGVGDEG